MNYIRQIIYEMRHQKMMTWVSIGGTALSIFLVMAVFMSDEAKTIGFAPETNRDKILTGHYIELRSTDPDNHRSSSGAASYETCRKLYFGLKGVERMSFMTDWPETFNVGIPGKKTVPMSARFTDEEFWKLYDFTFLYGKPYDGAACDSGEKKVVISRSVARELFQEDDVVGREIQLQHVPYVVCGVVEDVSPLLATTGTDLFIPFGPDKKKAGGYNEYMGNVRVQMVLKPGVEEESIKKQVEARYARINGTLKEKKEELGYHGQPYNAEIMAFGDYGSNTTPDLEGRKRNRYMVYVVLILLPAINLSSMTRSRLRHRVSEIGVRRAFGARKSSIIMQMLGENFIITLAGGVIGLLLSFLFMMMLYNVFFYAKSASGLVSDVAPALGMLFTWKSFLLALVFCFVLNLFSAFVPSWRASRTVPAQAIAKSR